MQHKIAEDTSVKYRMTCVWKTDGEGGGEGGERGKIDFFCIFFAVPAAAQIQQYDRKSRASSFDRKTFSFEQKRAKDQKQKRPNRKKNCRHVTEQKNSK